MKHLNHERRYLADLGQSFGLEVDDVLAERLISYLNRLLEENERINLTRITDPDAGIRLHVLDSLSALTEVKAAPAGPLLDIGTGGGFPGVPLAIAAGRSATLLDSVAKKAMAVEDILRTMDWAVDVHAVSARAEHHAREHACRYSVVTARAVAPLPSLVELASPLLRTNGVLVALKGAPSDEEVIAGDRACGFVGMKRISTRRFVLPDGGEQRTVLAYAKIGQPRILLPRREGLAQHSPLG